MTPSKRFILLAVAAQTIVATAQLPAQVVVPTDSAIRAILQGRVDTKRTVGIVAATLDHGRQAIYTAGSSGAPGVALDGNTVYEIGSITKVFTASLLAEMVARGEVRLDDPVATYLPNSVRVPSRNGKRITLLDLATQTSGLPRLPTNLTPADNNNPYADYTVQQLYSFLSGYELTRDIGAKYEYSNLGVGLLGHALALRAGKSYEDLVTERILRPLGMNDTRIVLSPSMKSRLTPGHSVSGGVVANWDLPTLAGAGALRSTANDLLRFLSANLDSTSAPLGRVLATTHFARRDVDGVRMRIGLNWHILTALGRPIVWHNGGTGGYRTFTGFDEANKRGVVVLSNQVVSPDDIGFHLLDQHAPLAPPPSTKVRTEVTRRTRASRGLRRRVPARSDLRHYHQTRRGISVRTGHRPAKVSDIRRGSGSILLQGSRRPDHVRKGSVRQSDASDPSPGRNGCPWSEEVMRVSG